MSCGEQEVQVNIPDELGNQSLDFLYKDVAYEKATHDPFDSDPIPFEDNAEVTTTALEYLSGKPVGYDELPVDDPEFMDAYSGGSKFQLALGGQAVAGIRFYEKDGSAEIDLIGVREQLAGNGLGQRLMRSAVALMEDRGDTELLSRNISRDGFKTRVAVFGRDNLAFYYTDQHREYGIDGPPPANAEEAEAALERAYAAISPEDRDTMTRYDTPPTFGVYVDLTKVDASEWERPVPAVVDAMRVIYKAAEQ